MRKSPTRPDFVDHVQRNDLCTGCGACESLAGKNRIEVVLQADSGLYRPQRRSLLDEATSSMLAEVCPGIGVSHPSPGSNFHPIWGPLESIRIGASADGEVRKTASSGGMLSALQIYLLESGLVDRVLSIRVARDDPFGTELAVCTTRQDVIASAGSRYAPSAPLKDILARLSEPGQFAFVGKPCDVAALRKLARQDSRVDQKVPYMLSFMCAGVPARQGTLDIVQHLDIQPDEVASFRYRGDGWPGFATATTRSGMIASMTYEESWQRKLSPKIQWRCKFCPDGTGEHADIACADAWHLTNDGSPDFSERDGRSYILVRTSGGANLLRSAELARYIDITEPADLNDLNKTQFHQAYRKITTLARLLALKITGTARPRYNLNLLARAARSGTVLSHIRAFFGAAKRSVAKRRYSQVHRSST